MLKKMKTLNKVKLCNTDYVIINSNDAKKRKSEMEVDTPEKSKKKKDKKYDQIETKEEVKEKKDKKKDK